MRRRRGQALIGGLAIIPLVTIIAAVMLSGLHTWSEASRLYAESMDKRYLAAAQHAEAYYNGSTLIIDNTGPVPVRLSKALVLLGNTTDEIMLNNTVLYPGEEENINASGMVSDAYIVTSSGAILHASPLRQHGGGGTLILEDSIAVNYTGLFLGGYIVRIGVDGWELLGKQGIVYYPSNWSFSPGDLAILRLQPAENPVIRVELQPYNHYVFDHGVLRTVEALEAGEYGGYRAYAGAQGFQLSIGNPRQVINESSVEEEIIPWYGKKGRIYTQVILQKPATSTATTFTVKVEDEGGMFQEKYTGTRLVFWVTFNPETMDEAICWNESFTPSSLISVKGVISIEWISGSYIEAVAKHFYKANYLLDLSVETNNTWIEYMDRNITMPLSRDSETRLPIYSDNTSLTATIYYPSITTLQTNLEARNITLWRGETLYAWSQGNGSLALSTSNTTIMQLEGTELSITRLQNSASRIEVVQTIDQLIVTGIPVGARLLIGSNAVTPLGSRAAATVENTPPRVIEAVIPIAVGARSSGETLRLPSKVYLSNDAYTVKVSTPSSPTLSKLYVTVPPGAAPATSMASRYINYGSWIQAVIDNPPPGQTLVIVFPRG